MALVQNAMKRRRGHQSHELVDVAEHVVAHLVAEDEECLRDVMSRAVLSHTTIRLVAPIPVTYAL